MEVDALESSGVVRESCKRFMNIIRRAFSLRDKRTRPERSTNSIELTEVLDTQQVSPPAGQASTSVEDSDVASTSRDSFNVVVVDAPSVYEDPFVAVTADGYVHVKYYYLFNRRTEFHNVDAHLPDMKKMSRRIRICRLRTVYYASPHQSLDPHKCKSWGMTRNDVWWASHLNRQETGNIFPTVVLDDGTTIKAGFTVINIDAFAETLQCLGLGQDVPFQNGLPSPPFSMLQIPYIDEEPELASDQQPRPGTAHVVVLPDCLRRRQPVAESPEISPTPSVTKKNK